MAMRSRAGPTALGDFGGPRFRTHAPPRAASGLGHDTQPGFLHAQTGCTTTRIITAHTSAERYVCEY